jgi:hypothetical protein
MESSNKSGILLRIVALQNPALQLRLKLKLVTWSEQKSSTVLDFWQQVTQTLKRSQFVLLTVYQSLFNRHFVSRCCYNLMFLSSAGSTIHPQLLADLKRRKFQLRYRASHQESFSGKNLENLLHPSGVQETFKSCSGQKYVYCLFKTIMLKFNKNVRVQSKKLWLFQS